MQAARGAALSQAPLPDEVPPGQDVPADQVPADEVRPGQVPAGRPVRRTRLLAVVATVVLALDIATKVAVVAELEGRRVLELLGGQLLIRVSRNSGAAFSFAEGYTVVFTIVAVAVVVAIVRLARRLYSAWWAVALGLLLAGATGNLLDRLLRSPGPGRGAVVDFIDFQVWPSFNVADSGIVVGGLLIVLASFRGIEVDGSPRSRKAEPA